VDSTSAKFIALKESMGLSWDQFIRTTDGSVHYPGVEKMWRSLREAGYLEKRTYRGLYCVGHEAFVTEKDLVDGKCQDHQKEPEVVEEENWFFKLSHFTKPIREKIASDELEILPVSRKNEIMALLDRGLEDVSFSRPKKSLAWGIPVPDDDEQTIYVWADALVNYISAIGYGRDEKNFERWWNEAERVQVIGKDILRFHAAIWPGMLLAAGLPLPNKLLVHGFITVDGQKMSKTIGNVIDPVEIAEKYGTDALRYFLLKEIPSGEDGDFSLEKFKTLYNAELANGIGNHAARILKMAVDNNAWPDELHEKEKIWEEEGGWKDVSINAELERFRLDNALRRLWFTIDVSEKVIAKLEPYNLIKTDLVKGKETIQLLVARLWDIANLLEPFLPATAEKIQNAIRSREVPPILFPRIP
jgi:methionyl-tRNA synthetase